VKYSLKRRCAAARRRRGSLKVGHKGGKAYAIVSRVDSSFNEVRVVDKHGKTITKEKKTNYDSVDE